VKSTKLRTRNDYDGPIALAFGGGTNSGGLIVEFARRGQRVDLITFSDTKGEKPETYEFVSVLSEWCAQNGLPRVTTVRAESPRPERGFEGLEGMCLRLENLPSKAFGYKSCSQRYKIEPQQKYLNHWEPAQVAWQDGRKVLQVIGYDAGEPQRAKDRTDERYDFWYPLIEWGWGREECVESIKRAGLPLPGKSACFFCPSMRKPEVIELSEKHPELFARAVEMERRALAGGKVTTIKGLGRHWSWEELVAADRAKRESMPEVSCDTDCACFDGETE
jgi:hypothetical protein